MVGKDDERKDQPRIEREEDFRTGGKSKLRDLMTDAELLTAIQSAVRSEVDDDTVIVTRETTAADVNGWDSLAHGRIMLTLEVTLGLRIDIEQTYEATTVGELIPILRAAATRTAR
jgi:acyl carrier protein